MTTRQQCRRCGQDDTDSPGTRRSSRLLRPSALYDEPTSKFLQHEHDGLHEADEDDHVIKSQEYDHHHDDERFQGSRFAPSTSATPPAASGITAAKALFGLPSSKIGKSSAPVEPVPPIWPKEKQTFSLFKKKEPGS